MESISLDMDDIFDDGGDLPLAHALPDLPDDDEEQTPEADPQDADNVEVLSRLKDLSKGAAKKVVRKPQPKLDATRLTGERGIPILPKCCNDIAFKGKGHEGEDLKVAMRFLEHWTHRLFPRMPFSEVLERIEKLGTKKQVQTCIKRMRLDMPILNDDFTSTKDDDDDVPSSTNDHNRADVDREAEDVFDEIVHEQNASQKRSSILNTLLATPSTSITEKTDSTPSSSMNGAIGQEQLAKIERNKKLAMERRAAKSGTPGLRFSNNLTPTHSPAATSTIVRDAQSTEVGPSPSKKVCTPPAQHSLSINEHTPPVVDASDLPVSYNHVTSSQNNAEMNTPSKASNENTQPHGSSIGQFTHDQQTEDEILFSLDSD